MTFYTGRPTVGNALPVEGEIPLSQALSAEVAEGFNSGPLVAWGEQSRLDRLNADPTAERVTKEEADAVLKQYRIETVNIPQHGVTKPYLDALTADRQAHLARQQQLQSAPSGIVSTPLKFMANLAGNLADPGNIALGAIPFFGEVRATSMLGRAGERFVQGAGYGALQTAATLPFVAKGQAAQGNEFTMGDMATNMLLGTVGGGILHAGGGVIADRLRARNMSEQVVNREYETEAPSSGAPPSPENAPVTPSSPLRTYPDIVPGSTLSDDVARSIETFRDDYAYRTAYNDIVPEYTRNLEMLASQPVPGGGNAERLQPNETLSALEQVNALLPEKTSAYQAQNMTLKDARQQAMKDIDAEQTPLTTTADRMRDQIEQHGVAEQSAQALADIQQGSISEPLRQRIERRAQEIRAALQQSPIAQGVKSAMQRYSEADWSVRNQAMRAAVAQMRRGEDVNIEPFFTLVDPDKKLTALDDLSTPHHVPPHPDDVAAAQAVQRQIKASGPSNTVEDALRQAEENLHHARQVNEAIAADDPTFSTLMNQVIEALNDTSIERAIRAAATCRIGKMNG